MANWPYEWNADWVAGWAAIVQAIGSIVAVYAAYLFAAGEAKRAKEELEEARKREQAAMEREERRRCARLQSFRATAQHLTLLASRLLENIHKSISQAADDKAPGIAKIQQLGVNHVLNRFLAFPLHELESPDEITSFAEQITRLEMCDQLMTTFGNAKASDTLLSDAKNTLLKALKKVFEEMWKTNEKLSQPLAP